MSFKVQKTESEIVQANLNDMDGKIIKPFFVSRFKTKKDKMAYTMLFSVKDDAKDTVYSAFVNDKKFIKAINDYLDECVADKASITGEDLAWFKVAVKRDIHTGMSFAYVNPL